jgi:transcriptional regulator with XRE-family HTH domain
MKTTITINTAVGKVVKALRLHLKYKQDFIAERANITVKTLANIESGRVGLEKLCRLSNVFSVPISLILSEALEIVETGQYNQLETYFEKPLS